MIYKDDPHYYLRWPGVGIGRYWKRKLSKARRKRAKLECEEIKTKCKVHSSESKCDYKTY